MDKKQFIKLVSKIDTTFEDEFKAEYNSPELIWKRLFRNELTRLQDRIDELVSISDKLYEENKQLKYWMNADIDTVKKYLNENVSDINNYNKSKQKLLCEIAKRLK